MDGGCAGNCFLLVDRFRANPTAANPWPGVLSIPTQPPKRCMRWSPRSLAWSRRRARHRGAEAGGSGEPGRLRKSGSEFGQSAFNESELAGRCPSELVLTEIGFLWAWRCTSECPGTLRQWKSSRRAMVGSDWPALIVQASRPLRSRHWERIYR